MPAKARAQEDEHPGYRCPGALRQRSRGAPLSAAPPTGPRPGRDTRRQSLPAPPGAGSFRAGTSAPGADLPHSQEDSRRSHPGEAGPSRQDLTLNVTGQNCQMTPMLLRRQGNSTVHGAPLQRPPWTPVHVDRRLEATTAMYPTPPIIYKGRSQP
jgi:hypothetical protein